MSSSLKNAELVGWWQPQLWSIRFCSSHHSPTPTPTPTVCSSLLLTSQTRSKIMKSEAWDLVIKESLWVGWGRVIVPGRSDGLYKREEEIFLSCSALSWWADRHEKWGNAFVSNPGSDVRLVSCFTEIQRHWWCRLWQLPSHCVHWIIVFCLFRAALSIKAICIGNGT